jgi:carbon storage regulator CsrA
MEVAVLILTRGEGERVVIPRARLEVVVQVINGNTVKLGFRAPQRYEIFRGEVFDRMAMDDWDEDEDTNEEDVK